MLEDGTYRARALEAEVGETSTGKEQVIVRFELLDPPHTNRKITYYGVMTERTEKSVVKGLMVCGWDGASEDFAGITRNEVDLEIEVEEGRDGNLRNRVRWINARKGALTKKPLDETQRAAFFGRVRGRAEQLRAEMDTDATPAGQNGEPFPF